MKKETIRFTLNGKKAEIGGNVWLTRDIAPGTKIVQSKAQETFYEGGLGI